MAAEADALRDDRARSGVFSNLAFVTDNGPKYIDLRDRLMPEELGKIIQATYRGQAGWAVLLRARLDELTLGAAIAATSEVSPDLSWSTRSISTTSSPSSSATLVRFITPRWRFQMALTTPSSSAPFLLRRRSPSSRWKSAWMLKAVVAFQRQGRVEARSIEPAAMFEDGFVREVIQR